MASNGKSFGFGSVLDQWLNHGGTSWAEARGALEQRQLALDQAAALRVEQQAAGAGMEAGPRFALDADPHGYAQSMNKNYEPRAIEGGSSGFGFGKAIGMAPKVGVNDSGVGYAQDGATTKQTGQIATPMTAQQAAADATAKRDAAVKEAMLPIEMLKAKASMIGATRPRVGAAAGGFGALPNGLVIGPPPPR